MRAVGYSLETAIADILDNSVSAGAQTIAIDYSTDVDDPYVAILDDGAGMSGAEARNAMRLAGNGLSTQRLESDLGRFGLGLKTASLSQCRRLTVVTRSSGQTTGVAWDLDHIAATNKWSLLVLSDAEIRDVPHFLELDTQNSGTLVVWTKFDRIQGTPREFSREFDEQMMRASKHIRLIFHQYLNGDSPCRRVRVLLNGNELSGFDPFLSTARGTQISPLEQLEVEGCPIDVQAFTLPYLNSLTPKQRELATIPGPVRDSQGFYLYRSGRLVIWGTWFRLMPRSEAGKLARVKVDIPNALDHLWGLDIKKSAAVPPLQVREQLKRLAGALVAPSERAISYRGRKAKSDDSVVRIWDVIEDRDGEFRYEINRKHPYLTELEKTLTDHEMKQLDDFLGMTEALFPSQDLMNRYSRDQVTTAGTYESDEHLRESLLSIWINSNGGYGSIPEFVNLFLNAEPWSKFKDEPDALINWISSHATIEGDAR